MDHLVGRGQRHDQHPAGDLAHHEPVRRGHSRVEERIAGPDVGNVIDSEVGVLEEVGHLLINLERLLIVEQIEIEQVVNHSTECNTDDYAEGTSPDVAGLRRRKVFEERCSVEDDRCDRPHRRAGDGSPMS